MSVFSIKSQIWWFDLCFIYYVMRCHSINIATDKNKVSHNSTNTTLTRDEAQESQTVESDETKINVFGSVGVKCVWRQTGKSRETSVLPTVKHDVGSVMVWGCMSAVGSGELQFTGNYKRQYCDKLKQSMSPSLHRLGHWAVFQHDNDPRHTSKTTTGLVEKLMEWTSMSPDLNPIKHLWALEWKVEVHKVMTSSWRLPGKRMKLCWALGPRRLRKWWKIMLATQSSETLGPIWKFSLRGGLTSSLDINARVLNNFEGAKHLD